MSQENQADQLFSNEKKKMLEKPKYKIIINNFTSKTTRKIVLKFKYIYIYIYLNRYKLIDIQILKKSI